MKNLKYVTENFVDWIAVNDEGLASVEGVYKDVVAQFMRYIGHAMVSVGGMYINPKYYGDPVKLYEYVPKAKQVAAFKFVLDNLNDGQHWLINDKIKAVKIYVEFYSFLCIIEVAETI